MVIIKNRTMLFPKLEQYIGTPYDNHSSERTFRISRLSIDGVDIAHLTFKVNVKRPDNSEDTDDLEKEVTQEDIILNWQIGNKIVGKSGTAFISIRAHDATGAVKWSTYYAPIYIGRMIDIPDLTESELSELEKMEAKLEIMWETEEHRVAAEEERDSAEIERNAAESERKAAESGREEAETERNQSENDRNTEELLRAQAESERAAAETERNQSENDRKAAELIRTEAESERAAAETERNQSENDRKAAEILRAQAESERAAAETERNQSENDRNTEELLRAQAESERALAEAERKQAENDRKAAEILRVEAEEERKEAEAARKEAEKEREEAERLRKEAEEQRVLAEAARDKGVDGLFYEENKLYLTSLGEIVSDPVEILQGSGSGSGGTSSVVKLKAESSGSLNVVEGDKVVIAFNFSSTDDDVETGDGVCEITVNGVKQTAFTVAQGSTSLDVTKYLTSGSNTVKVKCSDVYGAYKVLYFRIAVVDLKIESIFDDSIPYSDTIPFKFMLHGEIEKTVHIILDGSEVYTETTTLTNRQTTVNLNPAGHGVHTLEAYVNATLDEKQIESKHLKYEIVFVEESGTEILIASVYEESTVPQGTQVSIPWMIYNPAALYSRVDLVITSGGEEYSSQTIEVDRSRQYWNVRNYPIGEVTFTIRCGEVEKSHTLTVTESEIVVEPVTNDMELYLSSAGRSNSELDPSTWTYEDVATTFHGVNWSSTGWIPDENGDSVLRLAGGATAEIAFKPFKNDWKAYGKTIEIEFAVRDVNNREAVVISCMDGEIGFTFTADTATLKSQQSKISCNYCEEERIRVAFVIESKSEYRLMEIYLNGVLSGARQYPTSDIFAQENPANITIGSQYCGVDVYTIRSYTNALTKIEEKDNYIADIQDIGEKTRIFEENDIYNEYGAVQYSKMKEKIPVMTIIGNLPQSKGDKKDVRVIFEHNTDASLNYEDDAILDVQGTSSQWYIRKNYKGKTGTAHMHAKGQMPSRVFCTKADYAESTGTHNTQNANLVETLYDEKTPAQLVDERCRTTIYGYPIVIFHQQTENASPQFIGKYNYNFDKGSEEVYGFDGSFDVESWEFLNNTSDQCNFLAPINDNWADNFEARYPDEYENIARFKQMHDWVVSTIGDLDKFKAEFEQHFDLHYALIYYVYTSVMLMVDQRAKNMFLTYWADTGKWQPWFYDNDTCLGINNEGQLVFDYYHEDVDTLGGANVYNGQNSTLWSNFREAFADEIKECYQTLRNNGKLTYEKILEYFIENGSKKWSASIYNEDSDYKYISMLRSDGDASNLYQIRGNGEEHLKYFAKNRLNYFDSKWYASDYANNYVALRIYTPAEWEGVEPNADIGIIPFSHMYAGVRYKANGTLLQKRAAANEHVVFEAPDETFNDTETAIYGASEISSLGDLAPLYCGSINVSKASRLVNLKIGDATEGYANTNLTDLSVGTNRLLKVIDVRNCPNLTEHLGLSGCPNIEEIYATGSGITGVDLPDSGYVKVMMLPETIVNLTLKNQIYLETFELAGYEKLDTMNIENCPAIDVLDIMSKAANLKRIRLAKVNWEFNDVSTLQSIYNAGYKGVDEHGDPVDYANVSGKCHIESLTGAEYAEVKDHFPYMEITYTNLTSYLIFMSEDGTELTRQSVVNGADGTDPVADGTIQAPTKTATAQYTYSYAGWTTTLGGTVNANALKAVEADRYVYPAFTATVRTYTASFYNGSTLLQSVQNVPYGSDASYTGETPTKTGVDDPENYEFTGFSPDGKNITGNTSCYAQFKYTGYVYIALVERTLSGEYVNDRVASVGSYAFQSCTNLTSVDLPVATSIGYAAFFSCTKLTSIGLPVATSIGDSAFQSCTNLTSINLPLATSVGHYAFQRCTRLTSIDLPLATSIGSNAFSICTSLTSLILRNTEKVCTIGSSALNATKIASGTGYIYVPAALLESYKTASNWSTYADQFRAIEDYTEIIGGTNE